MSLLGTKQWHTSYGVDPTFKVFKMWASTLLVKHSLSGLSSGREPAEWPMRYWLTFLWPPRRPAFHDLQCASRVWPNRSCWLHCQL